MRQPARSAGSAVCGGVVRANRRGGLGELAGSGGGTGVVVVVVVVRIAGAGVSDGSTAGGDKPVGSEAGGVGEQRRCAGRARA